MPLCAYRRRTPMMFAALLSGAILAHGCGGSREDASVAANADAGQEPRVPAGWKGPQTMYFHDVMTECIVHEGVVQACPPQFPKRFLWKADDAGQPARADPYKYEQEQQGDPMTSCCLWWAK
jgi:hypothetical protein